MCTFVNNQDHLLKYKHQFTVHNETPLNQGIKSSWFSCTAFGITSPLAAFIQYSNISSPICCIVLVPSIMGPVSISMMSLMRRASLELVATFITGQTGLPVGVPKPVVNKIRVAPEAV